jgi:DNA-binding Lrp family transcriptional regulator
MTAAFVFVRLSSGGGASDAGSLHDAMHAVAGVKTVHFVAGPVDMIVFVEVADQSKLMETVGKIRSLKGVERTDTRIVLSM